MYKILKIKKNKIHKWLIKIFFKSLIITKIESNFFVLIKIILKSGIIIFIKMEKIIKKLKKVLKIY